jgi:hypothetical protein
MDDVITQLKSDIDDESTLNVYFSDYQLINFSIRAIKYVNTKLKFCQRFNYLCLQPNFDSYDLPTDFMSALYVVDYNHQKIMPYAKYNMERIKSLQTVEDTVFSLSPNIYQIDENKRKLYMDFVPDTTKYNAYTIHVNGYSYTSRPFVSMYDSGSFGYYFEPIIIKLVNASGQVSYSRVSAVDAVYKGTGTITWSGTTVTLSSADTGLTDGDILEVSYMYGATMVVESITVASHAGDHLSFTASTAPSHNCSVASNYHWTTRTTTGLTAMKKLYLSETNVTNEYPAFSVPTTCYLVDMALFYDYQPFVPVVGDGTITFSGTTGTISGNYRNYKLAAGDYLLVDNEVRKIESIADSGNFNTVVVDAAFTNTITSLSYRFYRISESIPVPVELEKLISMAAMYYVFLRQGETEKAYTLLSTVDERIEKEQISQVAENVNYANRRRKGYDANADINISFGTRG